MRRLDLIWLFLPEELLPLLIVGLALLSIIGLIRPARVVAFAGLVVLLPVISLVVEEVVARLPWYVVILLLVALLTNAARLILEFFFGQEAAGHILGRTVIGVFKFACILISLPLRAAAALLRLLAARKGRQAVTRR